MPTSVVAPFEFFCKYFLYVSGNKTGNLSYISTSARLSQNEGGKVSNFHSPSWSTIWMWNSVFQRHLKYLKYLQLLLLAIQFHPASGSTFRELKKQISCFSSWYRSHAQILRPISSQITGDTNVPLSNTSPFRTAICQPLYLTSLIFALSTLTRNGRKCY